MRELICTSYAEITGYNSGVNFKNVSKEKCMAMYFKNACVCLLSARDKNPDVDIALITNVEVPAEYAELLSERGIQIMRHEFDSFRFPPEYKWSLAFYKLSALEYALGLGYEKILLIDVDSYVIRSADDIWKELDYKFLASNTGEGLNVSYYRKLSQEASEFLGKEVIISHYSGSFLALNREHGRLFFKECHRIHEEMLRRGTVVQSGDEFLLSLFCYEHPEVIREADGYHQTFWTHQFRYVSTRYRFNPIIVAHLPSEKENGLFKIYGKYKRRRRVTDDYAFRVLHLNHLPLKAVIRNFLGLFLKKFRRYYCE